MQQRPLGYSDIGGNLLAPATHASATTVPRPPAPAEAAGCRIACSAVHISRSFCDSFLVLLPLLVATAVTVGWLVYLLRSENNPLQLVRGYPRSSAANIFRRIPLAFCRRSLLLSPTKGNLVATMGMASTPKATVASPNRDDGENVVSKNDNQPVKKMKVPVAWTIAGSDSGGGAGIQADLHAMRALGAHGCSIITALTAQNSVGVDAVEYCSEKMIRASFKSLRNDLFPGTIKLGMLGTAEIVDVVVDELKAVLEYAERTGRQKPLLVCDPVMVATTGAVLMEAGTKEKMIQTLFPLCKIVTPNKKEAELLAGFAIRSPDDAEKAARKILKDGKCDSILLKGGHSSSEDVVDVVQDLLMHRNGESIWLTLPRLDSKHTHGTGCTLSSAIAAVLAGGQGTVPGSLHRLGQRNLNNDVASACVLAKCYVHQGIRASSGIGEGAGPVAQTQWPCSPGSFPWVTSTAKQGGKDRPGPFPPMEGVEIAKRRHAQGGGRGGHSAAAAAAAASDIQLLPVVPDAKWVARLASIMDREGLSSCRHIQIRPKGLSREALEEEIKRACDIARESSSSSGGGVKLWVNDHWDLAIKYGAYGLHVGQEDLFRVDGKGCSTEVDLDKVKEAGLRIGVSTHTYEELAKGLAIRPSYISTGPVYYTNSKEIKYIPNGVAGIASWRELIDPSIPLVAIGGISLENARDCIEAGAVSLAVISAVTQQDDVTKALKDWDQLWTNDDDDQ